MRIWILNHYAAPPDRPTGTRHYDFGRVLAGQGHEVTIFASSFSHESLREDRLGCRQLMRAEHVDGVRFVWIRTVPYAGNDHRRVLNMLSYAAGVVIAQRRFARPDVVVGSSVHLAAPAAAYLIGRIRRAPFVFEVRDLWPQQLIDMGELREHGAAARAMRLTERFLYRRARVVISLLPGAAAYITKAGIPAERITYIPNGIADLPPAAASAPSLSTAALLQRIGQWRQAGCLVAGYAGAHGMANGLDVLIEAARVLRDREVNDIALVLVGDGPAKAGWERLAEECKLSNVLFWQQLPKREISFVLQALDVAVFPLRDGSVARYGLSSNKLFDYFASGRPVLSCSGVPGDPVQASGGGIWVPAQSPEAVAGALITLAAMGEAGRHSLGDRGRRWVREHHGVTRLAGQFLAALTQAGADDQGTRAAGGSRR